MDAIQTYRGIPAHAAPAQPPRAVAAALPANPAAIKTTSDYLRALRRRAWMVLAVAVPLATLACTYVLRMKPVYKVSAEIEINAPDYDPAVAALVTHEIGRRDGGSQAHYIPNRASQLKSARLQQKVVGATDLENLLSHFEDPVAELLPTLTVTPLQRNGNTFLVTLEGQDPFRTKRLLEVLLREFAAEASEESRKRMEDSRILATGNLAKLEQELGELKDRIKHKLTTSTTLGANGKSLIEEQVINLGIMLNQKQMKLGELSQQVLLMQNFPGMERGLGGARQKDPELAQLEVERRRVTNFLRNTKRTARNFNSEPAAIAASNRLKDILDQIDELKEIRTSVGLTPTARSATACSPRCAPGSPSTRRSSTCSRRATTRPGGSPT